jgi:hypothetical protein
LFYRAGASNVLYLIREERGKNTGKMMFLNLRDEGEKIGSGEGRKIT